MNNYSDSSIITLATELLQQQGLLSGQEVKSGCLDVELIASDGSTRRFWRCKVLDRSLCVIAAPLNTSDDEKRESKSAWYIGNHLRSKGCVVPQLLGWHEDSGMLLFEDLGDKRLHGMVATSNGLRPDDQHLLEMYTPVVRSLAHMQIAGGVGFNTDWCWDTKSYDKELMLKRESGYFLKAFWSDLLQQEIPGGIEEDFRLIADIAGKASADYFLHRDFQSRNIMVQQGKHIFIDFQGGRLGPLGYDLASLLIDPYCSLSTELQSELFELYWGEIAGAVSIDQSEFRGEYNALALQRNLQILGAFAFLSRVRKKSFFAAFIRPALVSAQLRLEQPVFNELKVLKKMINHGLRSMV